MKNLYILFFLLLLIGVQSCQDSSDPVFPVNSNFIYPLKIGNKWNYSISTVYTNIRPDSIKNNMPDYFINVQVFVSKNTILDSIKVYEMKEVSDGHMDSYAFYSNEKEGFLQHAYSTRPNHGFPITNSVKRFLFKGTYFNSITELIEKLDETVYVNKNLSDSIIYFEPPRKIYVYPLEVGKEWVFSSEFILINKEVVGKEIVMTNSGIYECFNIRWKYDFDRNGVWDDDFIYFEYVSSKGSLKSTYTIKDITISTIEYPDGIGKADVQYERVLMEINF